MSHSARKFSQILAAVAAAGALVSFAPIASAQAASQYQIGIEGKVPVICRVALDKVQTDANSGVVSLGQLKEFCNNAGGYDVVADYSPALAGAKLVVDGVEIPLGSAGSVKVSQSDRAAIASHTVELKQAGAPEAGALSFRIEPR